MRISSQGSENMKKITSVILCLVLLGSLFCTADFTAFAVEKVSAIKQVAAVKTGFRVKWSNTQGKSSYDVKISSSGTKTLVYKKLKSNVFTITNKLSPGKNYNVTVRSRKGKTVSEWSSPKTVTTCCADVNVRQTGYGKRTVTLAWNASPGAKGYKIYQKNITKNGLTSFTHVGTTTKTTKKIKLPVHSATAYKATNLALVVVPVRKSAGYRAESQIKNVSKRAYLNFPKSKPFMTFSPTVDSNNNLVLKSNNWVDGFNYKVYSTDGKLIESGSKTAENHSSVAFRLKNNVLCKVEAQAYISVGGKTSKSYWSSKVDICPKPVITPKWDSSFNLVVSWDKIKDVTGYNFKIEQAGNSSVVYKANDLSSNKITITKAQISSLSIQKSYKLTVLPYSKINNTKTKYDSNSITTTKAEIVGHRGAMDKAPENTKASFKKALKAGYDSFECDYWETKSGDLLVYHDQYMTSCGHPNKDIRTLKKKEIKKYPIKTGSNISSYATQYILTVEQVIKYASKLNLKLYLHTKDGKTSNKAMKKISAWIKKYKMGAKTTVFSGTASCAERISANISCTHGFLVNTPQSKEQIKNTLLYMSRNSMKLLIMKRNTYLDKELSSLAHNLGIRVGCYRNKTKAHAAKVLNKGADFVIADEYFLK